MAMLAIARVVAFIWVGPYRGKMMRAGGWWCAIVKVDLYSSLKIKLNQSNNLS
jgi:hypothetical protein